MPRLARQGTCLTAPLTRVCVPLCRYPHTPGIYTSAQQDGWRPIVEVGER